MKSLPQQPKGLPVYKFIIPGELPALNDALADAKNAAAGYGVKFSKKKNDADLKVTMVCREAFRGLKIYSRFSVLCVWHCKDKRKDPDNISHGIKYILDGMQKAGVIENDGWNQVSTILHQFTIAEASPYVEVYILPGRVFAPKLD